MSTKASIITSLVASAPPNLVADVTSYLNALPINIWEPLISPPSVADVDVNQSYFKYLEAEYRIIRVEKVLVRCTIDENGSVPRKADEMMMNMAIALTNIYRSIQALIVEAKAKFVKSIANPPRIVRILDKMDCHGKERRAFEMIVMNNVLHSYSDGHIHLVPQSVQNFVDMNILEIWGFMGSQKMWIKQQLFEYMDQSRMMDQDISIGAGVLKAVLGLELTDDELIKVDNTCISEAMEEEDPTIHQKKLSKSAEIPVPQENSDEETINEDEPSKDPVEPSTTHKTKQVTKGVVSSEDVTVAPEEEDFRDFLKKQIQFEKDNAPLPTKETKEAKDRDDSKLLPYSSDSDYLETEGKKFLYIFHSKRMEKLLAEARSALYFKAGDDSTQETRLRELKALVRGNRRRCERRLELTREAGTWLPRMERMVQIRGLDTFEREMVMALVSNYIIADIEYPNTKVGAILRAFCANLEEQIERRKYFYKSSKLIKEGIIKITGGSALDDDLMDATLSIDRRMLEFIMGIDSEFSELVEGSHLYFPKVKLDQVVLSSELKKLIVSTVETFEDFKKARKRLGFEETLTYGSGIVMLFYGASGTGKTMVANAIANYLDKRILLINFPSLGKMSAGENLKFIFREAKINDAIIFFDECESIFETRLKGNFEVNLLLTEIERHDGLVIMATNRAYDLDEAMHRRITLALEFTKPDPILRERIWRTNMPAQLPLKEDVNLKELAMSFELTGGFIKNAILSALSIAVGRDGEKNVKICQDDLETGARLQLRGKLRMIDFEHRVVPQRGLEALVLPPTKIAILKEVINYEKARQILLGQWGFDKMIGQDKANSVLFWGPPGCGKTLAAEAIAYSTGKPLKMINTGELVSKWVGDTPKNINAVFEDAAANDAVLVFDEADSLFGTRTAVESSSDRYGNMDVGLLLHQIEHYKGIVILCTNLVAQIDSAFFRRIKYEVEFTIPESNARATLWKKLVPDECPKDANINFTALGAKFEFAGGNIKSAIIRAAARASLRDDKRRLTYEDLEESAKEEQHKGGSRDARPAHLYT